MEYNGTITYTTIPEKLARDRVRQQRSVYGYKYITHYNTLRQKYNIDLLDEPYIKFEIVKKLGCGSLKV